MAELGTYHPDPQGDGARRLGGLPGVRFTPGMVFSIESGPIGPEATGAVLVLQNTLDTNEKAQQFWDRAALTLEAAQGSPGFIRFIGFSDGLENYGLGFWRTAEEAQAFAKAVTHREAVKELNATGNQYSHFAGLYRAEAVHRRHIFCDACGVQNDVRDRCAQCGNALVDSFRRTGAAVPA